MKNPLAKLPWFVGGPGFLAAIVVAAVVANYLGADYFKRTRLDEVDPLAGIPSAPADSGAVVAEGEFRGADAGHRGSGNARIIRDASGGLVLRLEDFSVTNGPDLFVVLSSEDGYTDGALNLGDLKATDGNFNYDIPAGTDISKFTSVVVWCRQFDVDFAIATLGGGGGAPAVQAASTATPVASSTVAATTPAGSTSTPPATSAATTVPTSASTQPPAATATPSGPVLLAQGTFRDGEPGHRGSGVAKLGRDANGQAVLVLEDFSVTNGPDLHVILGTGTEGSGSGLDLGELKATDGTFSYPIPAGTDLSLYKSVTIWCAAFPTVFAVATFGG